MGEGPKAIAKRLLRNSGPSQAETVYAKIDYETVASDLFG